MGDFTPLEPLQAPKMTADLLPQAERFQSFHPKWENKEAARVVRVAFSPAAPHKLAVVSGTKVGIWSAGPTGDATNDIKFSKFKDTTQCVSWRSDGNLALIGDAAGTCSVYEMGTKKSLRRFRGHGDAVICASFASADRSRAATGGRDGRLRTWDVATGELLQTIDAHSDSLKVLVSGAGGPDAWITAGYDNRVRLWDLRASDSQCVATADHGQAVEEGVSFPGGAVFASAGGPVVKIWDFAAGGKPLQVLEAHSKVTTGVCLDSQATVLLTSSFDGTAKLWNTADFNHLYTFRLGKPANCSSWRLDDQAFAVGMDDGSWVTYEYRKSLEERRAEKRARRLEEGPKVHGDFRGVDAYPAPGDEIVRVQPQKRPKSNCGWEVDWYLRKFEYRKLLDHMILPSTDELVGFAIVDELLQRGALAKTLSDLDEARCLSALNWFCRVFQKGDSVRYQLFEEALHTFLDHNSCLKPPSTPQLTAACERLTTKIESELKTQQVLMETSGMFKSIMLI